MTRKILTDQSITLKLQQFESTFFSSVNLLNNIIGNIHYYKPEPEKAISRDAPIQIKSEHQYIGRDCFEYREEYLEINSFGRIPETSLMIADETEVDREVEEKVKEEHFQMAQKGESQMQLTSSSIIESALKKGKYLSFLYENKPRLVKPITFEKKSLIAYCYIKNFNDSFNLDGMTLLVLKDQPFTLEASGPNIGLDRIATIIHTAIQYNKYVRMRYTRSAWTQYAVIPDTGELLIIDQKEAEVSIRTISNVQLTIHANDANQLWFTPSDKHITSYCHKRNDTRNFRYDRIGELAILNI